MSDNENGSWCLIESDPAVFSELIVNFGVSGLQMEELYTLEKDTFDAIEPIHGLIFLFKWIKDDLEIGEVILDEAKLENIFFAKQVVDNACATQAILNVLMNCKHPDVELGNILTEFKDFCQYFDSYNRGLTLSNSSQIRNVHNSFARPTLYEVDPEAPKEEEDSYHFVGFMPIDGRLYELDGLKEGPIDHGEIPEGVNWTDVVRPVLAKRIHRYNEGEIHFNLMAIVSDRLKKSQEALANLLNGSISEMLDIQSEASRLQDIIELEIEKRKRYKIDNIRRKHNYLPFIVELLKGLGEKKLLVPIYERAKTRAIERQTKVETKKKKKNTHRSKN